jgi:ABC-type nickel/cobalt efflux system permease component RcnA
MALGMTTTVAAFAVAVILSRRWLAQLLAHHGAKVERIARGLEILGAAAVTMIGLTLLAGEIT